MILEQVQKIVNKTISQDKSQKIDRVQNMNALKYKKRQETSILQPVEVITSSKFQKYNFLQHNQNKKPHEPIKFQRSFRQPKILIKKERYESIQTSMQRKQQIRSLSLRRSNQETEKSLEKSILFKRPVRNKHKTINSSIEVSRPQLNPHIDRQRRSSQNKKLSILDQEPFNKRSIDSSSLSKNQLTLIIRFNQYQTKKSQSKTKFRVKSTFTKLDSIDLINSTSQDSSSLTLIHKQKSSKSSSKAKLEHLLEKIKLLIKQQHYREALSLIKRTFSQHGSMDNVELLELFTIAMYNLGEYQEVTKVVQKLFLLTPQVSSQIYVMSCLSHAKIKSYTKALQIIQRGTVKYPQNAQIFYYKGKILYHTRKFHLAQESFSNSYSICSLPQTLVCLADCYSKNNKKQEEIKTLDRLLATSESDSVLNFESFLVRKFRILFELSRYDQILTEVHSLQQIFRQGKLVQTKAQIDFIEAICRYKKGMSQSAYEKFQDCIVSQCFSLQSLKMLTVIQIKEKNFYQASHLCGQVIKKGLKTESDDIFNLLMNFVEGSISLVRRNFKEGIEHLAKVELALDKKEFNKYSSVNEWKSYEEFENYEVHKTARQLVHLFLAYGLFCTGEYKYCQSAIIRQKNILNDPMYTNGLNYNYKLCEAIQSFQQKLYSQSLEYLQEADAIFPQRLQVLFYKAVVLIQVYYMANEPDEIDHKFQQCYDEMMADEVNQCFSKALTKVSSTANNTRATILYHKTFFCAYLKDWKQALTSIQQAITKSDDTYWRYYYTKGMVFACIHNFQEAIASLTQAIDFSQSTRPECFLLRSKCLQIEARGNQAFYDLQQYIALRPEDQDVHMYAGQLLFQNGAFEDALTAFEHKEIPQFPQNYDIYLTLAKTLFLTGKFNQAQQKMLQAYKLSPQDTEILFDSKIIKILGKLIHSINDNTLQETQPTLTEQLLECFNGQNKEKKFGNIFKQMDLYLMQGLIAIYLNDYMKSIENFNKHLSEKRKMIIFEDNSEVESSFLHNKSQDDLEKTSNQLKIYTHQMKFNIVLCYLVGGDVNTAKQILKDIKIDETELFYANFCKFRNAIVSENFLIEKEEILPNKNKLSQFLPSFSINVNCKKTQFKVKPCIPYPKVQPPDIFPVFDRKLLKTLSFFGIEGKPEAPWIVKQDNVIKFTQKISYASRLDFNDSEPSNSTTVIIDLQDSRVQQQNRLQTKSNDRSSMFSKRTLKKKNSINMAVDF